MPGRLRHVVQLHLSRECNRPELAQEAARAAVADTDAIGVHTARQERPCRTLTVGPALTRRRLFSRPRARRSVPLAVGGWLPGFEP
jgi:hypothetical protein